MTMKKSLNNDKLIVFTFFKENFMVNEIRMSPKTISFIGIFASLLEGNNVFVKIRIKNN